MDFFVLSFFQGFDVFVVVVVAVVAVAVDVVLSVGGRGVAAAPALE